MEEKLFQHAVQACENSEFKITQDEQEKLLKAFQEPEFRKIFSEYVDEISDPKYREEQEMYIRQLEGEKKVPEGKEVLHPEPVFCIKTRRNQSKVFINVCFHERVDESSIQDATQSGQKDLQGQNWSIPYILNHPRMDKDKQGNNCLTIDICFSKRTINHAATDSRFRMLVIQTAIEAIEENHIKKMDENDHLDRDFHILRGVKCKGDKPSTFIVAKSSSEKPLKSTAKTAKPCVKSRKESNQSKKISQNKVPVPKYTITHQGRLDMADFFTNIDSEIHPMRPQNLVVKIDLPKLSSAQSIRLDISERQLILDSSPTYYLDVVLPYQVDSEKGSAKFDKGQRSLTITLPVCPPQPSVAPHHFNDLTPESNVECEEENQVDASVSKETQQNYSSLHSRWVCNSSLTNGNKLQSSEDKTTPLNQAENHNSKQKIDQKPNEFIENSNQEKMDKKQLIQETDQRIKQDTSSVSDANFSTSQTHFVDENEPAQIQDSPESFVNESLTKDSCDILQAVEPPFDWRQSSRCVSLVIRVPGILSESVRTQFLSREMRLEMESKDECLHKWQLCLHFCEEIIPDECRHSVSSKNMVVVLKKTCEMKWSALLQSSDSNDKAHDSPLVDPVTTKNQDEKIAPLISSQTNQSDTFCIPALRTNALFELD